VGNAIGWESNGDVFETVYDGEKVTVKQFDLSKNFQCYEREVKAYKHLGKTAWGKFVPKPKFIASSQSGMVRFLGLELGTPVEDYYKSGVGIILTQLDIVYNFTYLDSDDTKDLWINRRKKDTDI
jgi:hypothetical protein